MFYVAVKIKSSTAAVMTSFISVYANHENEVFCLLSPTKSCKSFLINCLWFIALHFLSCYAAMEL